MQSIKDGAADFLNHQRVAVTGVSRNAGRPTGGGDAAYPDLRSIPGGVQTVVIGTRPERAQATMEECAELGIKQVWMYRGPGGGSVSREAAEWGRTRGMTVIDGGCPLMFDPTSDGGHSVMRWMFSLTGNVPGHV
jgi:hypothetical protein